MSRAVRFSRRRNFFVKQWLQMRYMLILVGGSLFGGFVYAVLLRRIVKGRLVELMYQSHSLIPNTWEGLYPVVMKATLILFVGCVATLFILLQLFSRRVARAGAAVEGALETLADGGESDPGSADAGLKEFGKLAEKVRDLVGSYRIRWKSLDEKAENLSRLVRKLEEEGDHKERLKLLLELDNVLEDLKGRARSYGEEAGA